MNTLAPRRLIKKHLAKALGVSRPTLDAVFRLPGAPRPNQAGTYSVAQVKEWLATNAPRAGGGSGSELATVRQRKLTLETDRMAWEFAKARGEFIQKGEVAKTIIPLWAELHQSLRQKFEFELPSKYKGKSQVECQQLNIAALDEVDRRFREGSLPLVEATQQQPTS